MPLRSRVDSKKAEAERLQAVVVDLLREEENKYCADCEAKQPRWASWNLGVFLCIRCAGIHRNLGVHLTKVKSVNLDSWTPEQVQSMRVMGNKLARRVYEAELPEHFRRPQTDSALESFIRAKYEHKRYMLKDWSPPQIDLKDLSRLIDKRQNSEGLRANTRCLERLPSSLQKQAVSTDGNLLMGASSSEFNNPVSEAPPLLDLGSPNETSPLPKDTGITNNAELANTDLFDDFGPIVSAMSRDAQTNSLSSDIIASSSYTENSLKYSTSASSVSDLVSTLEPKCCTVEKKSTSDILALYDTIPVFQSKKTNHHFANIPSGDLSALPTSNTVSTPNIAGNFFTPSVVPLAQPAYGPTLNAPSTELPSTEVNNFTSQDCVFLSKENAAAFAAASPFANVNAQTKNLFNSSNQQGYQNFLINPTAESKSSLDSFTADFSQLGIQRGSSNNQANIPWN